MAAKKAARGKARKRTPAGAGNQRRRIVDAALDLAEADGWQAVGFNRLSDRLGIELVALRRRFRDQDAIADAWFRRGLDAMLAKTPAGFRHMPARRRLETLLLRWFDALAPHRRVTAEMLAGKLWPFHPHHYVPMVFNLSRLIQWLRDAAGLTAQGPRRQAEEIGLTLVFLATLARWCRDDSDGQARTREFLAARLDRADALLTRVACRRDA